MEPPSVCGNRMAAFTAVYLQNGAPSGYSINLQFDNYTQQAHVSQALLSFQVFRNLGIGVWGSAQFVQICVRVKRINKQTKTQEQSPPFKTLTLTSPTFCGVPRRQEIPFLVLMSVFLVQGQVILGYLFRSFSGKQIIPKGGTYHLFCK